MPSKKKRRNLLYGSSKMARLQSAYKPSTSMKSLKKNSPIADAESAVAASVTVVTEENAILKVTEVVDESLEVLVNPIPELSMAALQLQKTNEDITPTSGEEEGVGCSTHKCSVLETEKVPSPVLLECAKETKTYASLLKVSAELGEVGTPIEHVSGAPFVLIPDENIAAAKKEFKEFIYARFHGDWPSMGRIIGVVNALWARTGPRIFVHNVAKESSC
ncbi:Uncharacterized protein Rs2_36999 [Raphanus sativus]|nr:Uncharacterized protein Rs2_36999 [Raphanus sativus]